MATGAAIVAMALALAPSSGAGEACFKEGPPPGPCFGISIGNILEILPCLFCLLFSLRTATTVIDLEELP